MTPGAWPTRRLVLAAAGLLLPHFSRAEPTKHHRIAYLAAGSPVATDPLLEVFRQGLRTLGYDDGEIEIEFRGRTDRSSAFPILLPKLCGSPRKSSS